MYNYANVLFLLQAAIWDSLNHYAYADATFLAERLFAEGMPKLNVQSQSNCFIMLYKRFYKIREVFCALIWDLVVYI